ncbi:MAG TPA: VanZ family protein [Thermoanaerobaculia bacterium]|nr:VanZ family protein [Thermoanaerobaculia bacterium]
MVEPEDRRRALRWLPPLALSVAVVAAAPFVGVLQREVRESFGLGYLRWVTGALAVAGALALLWAIARIRERRALRYGALALAGSLVALQVVSWSTGAIETDVLERVHLLEYGLLAVLFERAFRVRHPGRLLPVLAFAAVALVSVADEGVQWLTPVRVGDVRDVVLNLWAGAVGLLFGVALSPPPGLFRASAPASARLAAALGAAVVLAGTAFLDAAHLGHEIRDPRAGVFLSWHSPEELLQAAEDRGRRWPVEGPPPARPLALEDYFRTAAGWHVSARNHAATVGDLAKAWRENRILERWYRPFLRLGHAWPPEQRSAYREELRARQPWALGPSPAYRSPVLVGRVVPGPPRALLWTAAAALAGALAWAALGRRKMAGADTEPAAAPPPEGEESR